MKSSPHVLKKIVDPSSNLLFLNLIFTKSSRKWSLIPLVKFVQIDACPMMPAMIMTMEQLANNTLAYVA